MGVPVQLDDPRVFHTAGRMHRPSDGEPECGYVRNGKRSVLPVTGVAAVGQAPSNSEPIRSGRPSCAGDIDRCWPSTTAASGWPLPRPYRVHRTLTRNGLRWATGIPLKMREPAGERPLRCTLFGVTSVSRVVCDRRGCFPSGTRLAWLRQRIAVAMRRVVVLRCYAAVLLRGVPFGARVSTNRLVVSLPRLGISGSVAAADSAPSRSAVADCAEPTACVTGQTVRLPLQGVPAHLVVDFFGGCLVRLRRFSGVATGFGTR